MSTNTHGHIWPLQNCQQHFEIPPIVLNHILTKGAQVSFLIQKNRGRLNIQYAMVLIDYFMLNAKRPYYPRTNIA